MYVQNNHTFNFAVCLYFIFLVDICVLVSFLASLEPYGKCVECNNLLQKICKMEKVLMCDFVIHVIQEHSN